MLSEEEKKAIEEFKSWVEFEKNNKDKINNADLLIEVQETILNLIEKQQKEIEKLKENNGYHLGFIDGGIAKRYEYQDKIEAKIEELKEDIKYSANPLSIDNSKFGIKVLQSLLEKE